MVGFVVAVVMQALFGAPPEGREAPAIDEGPHPAEAIIFRLPAECRPRRPRELRVFQDCTLEERLSVPLDASAAPLALPVLRAPVVVPGELAAVPRYCAFAPVPALDAQPDRFFAYEDRDVGRCYVFAPLDRAALATLGRYDARAFLDGVYPYMRAAMLRALAEAARAGHRFRVINGRNDSATRPSWHTFGLAIDVNLAGRKGLKEATRAYLSGAERDAWLTLAAAAERLGLYWLGRNDPDEIFHFEWRPGWTGLPHGELAAGLARDKAEGGVECVWQRLRFDPSRPSALAGLRDDP